MHLVFKCFPDASYLGWKWTLPKRFCINQEKFWLGLPKVEWLLWVVGWGSGELPPWKCAILCQPDNGIIPWPAAWQLGPPDHFPAFFQLLCLKREKGKAVNLPVLLWRNGRRGGQPSLHPSWRESKESLRQLQSAMLGGFQCLIYLAEVTGREGSRGGSSNG